MANNSDKKELKKAGISDDDLEDMMEYGLVTDGWRVGGSNDVKT